MLAETTERTGHLMLNQVVLEFVKKQKERMPTNGVAICGSYTQGRYGPHSDIDIVFLTASNSKVEAKHISYHSTLFHRLTASPYRLRHFLVESTEDPFAIAVLHSLASDVDIVEDSLPLRELINHSKTLVFERGITFDPQDSHAIILQGRRYKIKKEADLWKLIPAGAAKVG